MKGTIEAAGFLIDTNLIGEAEASRRVIEHWQDGARLRAAPDGQWLLFLPVPVTIRLDRAPGLALAQAEVSDVAKLPHRVELKIAGLPEIDLAIDLADIPTYQLQPIEAVPASVVLPSHEAIDTPDLRAAADIAPRARRRTFGSSPSNGKPNPLPSVLDGLWRAGLIAAVVGLTISLLKHAPDPNTIVCVAAVVGTLTGLIWALRRGGGSAARRGRSGVASRSPAKQRLARLRNRLAGMAFSSPIGNLVARRHLAFLQRIERAFRQRDWEMALREAVPLGGAGGVLSMSLPRAWQGRLSPSLAKRDGGRALGIGGIDAMFSEVYRRAAAELEQSGQIEKAAYVLADLLDTPTQAVVLLERHKMHQLAARLAEARKLEPAMVIRLWWRAGDRQRAIDIAQLRAAFATALDRLGNNDPETALQLRTAWVQSRRAAGDHLGAVMAAWPDQRLRDAAVADLQQIMALGGAGAAHALAYLLNLKDVDHARDAALALLDATDQSLRPAQQRFVAAFADLAAASALHDRQIATAAVRTMTCHGFPKYQRKLFEQLTKRADKLTVADMPHPRTLPKSPILSHVCASMPPGDLPVYDAVWLADRILIAHGGHGVRLVKPDGREVARWDTPAHRLVPSDSGTRVILATIDQQTHELYKLDLLTRRVQRWATLRASAMASTYDGNILTVVDEDGIAFLSTAEDKPRVIWRELDREHEVLLLERAQTGITALVHIPARQRHELWTWGAPAAMLRQRPAVDLTDVHSASVLAGGHLVTLSQQGVYLLQNGHWRKHVASAAAGATLVASGDSYAIVDPEPDHNLVTIRQSLGIQALAHLQIPGHIVGMREASGRVILWTQSGRVVGVDLDQQQINADFRTITR